MKLTLPFSCALLLASVPGMLHAQNASGTASGESPAVSGDSKPGLREEMARVFEELRALREENEELRQRLMRLEMNAGPGPAPAAPQPTVAVAAAPSPAVPEAKDAATPAPENPLKLFTPYGELGFRWQGFFYKNPVTGPTPSSFNNNLYNRGEALVRLGLSGQITSRLSYTLRLSSGESRLAGEPWISSASPGARRFVGFDAYNLTFSAPTAKVSPNLTDLVIVGKVNNVPAATGLTEMLIDKDFGVELAANLAIYKFNANTSGSLLTSIGFVTNQGSVGQRFLSPVVSGQVGSPGGLLFGITSDINQYGSPRANAYLIEAAVDHTISSATKLRGSFAFVNISHPSDVPLFIGLTGLLGLNGLNEPNMPQGIQTNLPACLPRNPDGVVPISSTSGGTAGIGGALMTGEAACGYASAYRLFDFYGSATVRADQKYPIRMLGEFVRNFGAGAYVDKVTTLPADLSASFPGVTFMSPQALARLAKKRRDGLVLGVDFGSKDAEHSYSMAYKFVLIGSDIMLDYPTNDQWHTNIRGHELDWQYRFTKNVALFSSFMFSKNYDPLLPGFSSLATYPLQDLKAGQNPWMIRPRTGVHITF